MHTYQKLIKSLFLVLIALCCSCNDQKTSETAISKTSEKKPNIILILTDDQGYGDIGYHGNPILNTPHLDQFAKESLELTNFHVGTTCAPTRAGIMTARNANRNNAWHTIAGCSILLDDEETMPEVFAKNGYNTTMFGKWHLGDNYPYRPFDRGFQNAFYHGGGGVQQTPDLWNNNYFDDTYFRNGIPEKTEGYSTDVWFNEAIAYTKKQSNSPFFMYLALNAAHSPFNVPKAYADLYANAELTDVQKRFYGMISNIDDNFGRFIKHLKETDVFDNTIIIFTTDNGTAAGIKYQKETKEPLGYNAGLKGTKGSHYDGGHKVPFFISWPKGGIKQKTASNELIAHVDLLPTLAELTGLNYESKKVLDGKSMAASLTGQATDTTRMLVVDTQRNQWPEKGRNSTVMQGTWRLVNGTELYNTKNDPGQQNDISNTYPNRVKKMQTFYDLWWQSLQNDIRYAEIPLGNDKANPVLITVHDLHTEENLPWNQVQIRQAKAFPKGYYSVKIVEDGTYEFKLYRYPPETQLALNATVNEIPKTPFISELPTGKILAVSGGVIQIDDQKFESSKNASDEFILIKTELKKGSYKLKSNFILENGKTVSAYYTKIEKI